MKLLLLNPPTYKNFDGGAGSRYQATREVSSFWYPAWLCYAAGLVKESRVLDAPADNLGIEQVKSVARQYDIVAIYTSTPSFQKDVQTAMAIKEAHPGQQVVVGFVGPHPSVLPEETLLSSDAVDFVARREFDYTIKELADGKPWGQIQGLSYKQNGMIIHNPDRPFIDELDRLSFVTSIYHRDLNYRNYKIPYLLYPYVSIYSGRGCPGQCTYCLWPQTLTGHTYRTRSVENVVQEIRHAIGLFPDVREIFFDDDTFTADQHRIIKFCEAVKPLGITWSATSRANVKYEVLRSMKEAGLRLLVVGYESGNPGILKTIKKGISIDQMRWFTRDCHKLGIKIHGTFILGLPGENHRTIEDSVRLACELEPDTIQVSLASAYPGTVFYKLCQSDGYFIKPDWVDEGGYQLFNLKYEGIEPTEIYKSVETFYKRFYYRPRRLAKIILAMIKNPEERKQKLKQGKEFKAFLRRRNEILKKLQR